MTFGRLKIAGVILAAMFVAVFAGAAGAQGADDPADRGGRQAALKAQVREHDATLEEEIEHLAAVGAELEDTQTRMDGVRARARELRDEMRSMKRDLEIHRQTFEVSKARYEEQARAAYKGNDLEGLAILLRSFLGGGGSSGSTADIQVAGILLDGQENMETYGDSHRTLSNTIRQLAQKKEAYNEMLEQERVEAEKLRRQEKQLDAAIASIRSDRNRAEIRLQELEAKERERIRRMRAATASIEPPPSDHNQDESREGEAPGRKHGGKPQSEDDSLKETEGQIAEEEIYAQPLEDLSDAKYRKLYKKATKQYGFARDWYVLAAVGKIESNHGESMGPSSAGAMGPMQFLPSTWEVAGVDGNGDGKANIMDPRDAIPAAAGYLRDGGAPDDWYAALYSYNHADWYVKEVLAVAEGYRKLAKDDRVGPYI